MPAFPAFINLSTNPPAVQAAVMGEALPEIVGTLRTRLVIAAAFVTSGVAGELEAGTTCRFVIKADDDADGALLFHDAAADETGAGTSKLYTFSGVLDCAALRTALGGADYILARAQFEWTLPAATEPEFSKSFLIRINNANYRPTDTAPDLADQYQFVLNDQENAIEVFIGGASKGFLHLNTTAP